MAEVAVVIEGDVVIEPAIALNDAVAEVRLRDTMLADAPSRTIACVRIACSGGSVGRIPFRLPASVEQGQDYSLAAEVRLGGGDRLRPGDLLTVEHHGWTDVDGGPVTLKVRQTN